MPHTDPIKHAFSTPINLLIQTAHHLLPVFPLPLNAVSTAHRILQVADEQG